MKVITLTPQLLQQQCRQLAHPVMCSYKPDVVVGIRRGGDFVARKMLTYLPDDVQYVTAEAHRRLSKSKNSSGGTSVLKHLPRFITNFMRRVESYMTSLRLRNAKPIERVVRLDQPCNTPQRILVVDDAVDTGSTLVAVTERLRQLYPQAEIRTAALTLTQPCALITPDYALYRDRTLLRFPWAADY